MTEDGHLFHGQGAEEAGNINVIGARLLLH